MRPRVSAVVVSHRSAAEAAACVASLREAFLRDEIRGEIILVDCGSGPEEQSRIVQIPADRRCLLSDNRGYSGGANAGIGAATGEEILLSNADVIFRPGSVSALVAALENPDVGAAAPLCFWDAEDRLLLPPGFAPGFLRDLSQLSPGRRPRADDRRFASFARETVRLWRAGGRAPHLSGAVLAFRRDVFDRVGRFDEAFPHEYEETEWEDRVRAARLELHLVREARVRHLWAVSSSRNPETSARRAASQRLYRDRRYGRFGRLWLERAAAVHRRPRSLAPFTRSRNPPVFAPQAGAFLGVSPNPSRLPFAGADLAKGFSFSSEIAGSLTGRWYFTVFEAETGRPLQTAAWERE